MLPCAAVPPDISAVPEMATAVVLEQASSSVASVCGSEAIQSLDTAEFASQAGSVASAGAQAAGGAGAGSGACRRRLLCGGWRGWCCMR